MWATLAAWAAICFALPMSLLAACLLVPNALELADRILRASWLPKLPLAVMLLAQIALILLPMAMLMAWRRGRGVIVARPQGARVITLAAMTAGIALLAYAGMAVVLAAFPS